MIDELRVFISDLLGMPSADIAPEDSLADLGFDSLTLAQLAKDLSQRYGVPLSPSIFLSFPTIARLRELVSHLREPRDAAAAQ